MYCSEKSKSDEGGLKATRDADPSVRMAAAMGIGGIGAEPETAHAVASLLRLLNDESAAVRAEAARALTDVWIRDEDGQTVRRALESALHDPHNEVREAAEEAMSAQGY